MRQRSVGGDAQPLGVAARLGEHKAALDRRQGRRGQARGIGVETQSASSAHGLQAVAQRRLPALVAVGQQPARVLVVLGELAHQAPDRAAPAGLALDLDGDQRVEPLPDGAPGRQVGEPGLGADDRVHGGRVHRAHEVGVVAATPRRIISSADASTIRSRRELDRRLGELTERGVDVVSISGESEERATRMRDDWGIEHLPLTHGRGEQQMREWGLFVSRSINDDEPPVFNEPALFLIRPDGSVYYRSILSMPVGRPRLDDLLGGIDFWTAHDYPARGDA